MKEQDVELVNVSGSIWHKHGPRLRVGAMTGPDRNGLFEKAGQALPVGRVGEPEDLAQTYLYLMRERFSTGAIIVVDGGSTLA